MSRTRTNLNRDWRFCRGDVPGASRIDFDDSLWQRVGLPHTFDLPYFRTPEFYVGVGWYRKRINTRGLPFGKWYTGWLEFDGALQVAEIFMNGNRVGEHHGGYTGFAFDVGFSPGENVLAIRVTNEWNPQIAPRAGEHIFSGGLYRDVHLVVGRPLIQWNGIGISTPQVSRESAIVHVTTEVRNAPFSSLRCNARQTILDPDGVVVATFQTIKRLKADECFEFNQTSPPIANPKLWHPDHPHLYTLRTEVFRDRPLQATETEFGFRWFEWTADRGFFLNGEHLYLRGANAHQDHAGWGIAITQAACERDVRLIKEAGFNFVRGAPLSASSRIRRCLRSARADLLAGKLLLGQGRLWPRGILERQRLSGERMRFRAVRSALQTVAR